MITKKRVANKEVILFSVGQAAARLHRSAATLRRLERTGRIPKPFHRSDDDYRLYSMHEVNCLEKAFIKFDCMRGKAFDPEFTRYLVLLFDAIHHHYRGHAVSLPTEALE